MSNKIVITPMDDYIYVEVTGSGNTDDAVELWKMIAASCNQHQCFNVLGILKSNIALDTLTSLNHHAVFQEVGIDKRYRLAWVGQHPRTFESIEFIKNVLANRATGYGKVFSDEEKAKNWLLNQTRK